MISFEYNSKQALTFRRVRTLGEGGGSSDQEKDERKCLRYCSILGLDNIYIGVFTF